MQRYDFFFDQLVTEGQIDAAFDGAEQADWDIVADAGLVGIASGLEVTEEATTPDLTVDVQVGTAYSQAGKRIRVGVLQNVDLSEDYLGASTAVATPGNSKIVSVFVGADRTLSDPQIDGNSNTVYFNRAETFAFMVKQGAEAVSPSAPALEGDKILLADVTLVNAQTQILDADIDMETRRQMAFNVSAGAFAIAEGTSEEAIQALLTLFNNHVTDVANAHDATAILAAAYAGTGIDLTEGTVASQLEEIADEAAGLTADNVFSGANEFAEAAVTALTATSGTFGDTNQTLINDGQANFGVLVQLNDELVIGDPKTPAALGATENDYEPADWATSTMQRLTPASGGSAITGFAARTNRVKIIINLSDVDSLTLKHDDAGSAAANRIYGPGNVDFVIPPRGGCMLAYDNRWRVFGV